MFCFPHVFSLAGAKIPVKHIPQNYLVRQVNLSAPKLWGEAKLAGAECFQPISIFIFNFFGIFFVHLLSNAADQEL